MVENSKYSMWVSLPTVDKFGVPVLEKLNVPLLLGGLEFAEILESSLKSSSSSSSRMADFDCSASTWNTKVVAFFMCYP